MPRSRPSRLVAHLLASSLLLIAPGVRAQDVTVAHDAPVPGWLVEALDALEAGTTAYYDARFEEALAQLQSASKVLVAHHEDYPVARDRIAAAVIFLILTLHALDRDDQARELSEGLVEVKPPPWAEGLDLSPAAREYLEQLESDVEPPPGSLLDVVLPLPPCEVLIDGLPAVGEAPYALAAGTHWVQISCDGVYSDHHRVVLDAGASFDLDLSHLTLDAVTVKESPAEKPGLLLDQGEVRAKPWYGDAANLVLQASGVVLVATALGLLVGSMRVYEEARKTTSLRYLGLEDRATSLSISGWTLLGAGAVGLVVGVIRMSVMGGEGS